MEELHHINNEMIRKVQQDHLEPDKLLCHLGWYRLLTQRDIVTQRDNLLDKLVIIQDQALRASMVQNRSVNIIKQTCAYIAKEAKQAISEAESEVK
jgi:hypothetical protein